MNIDLDAHSAGFCHFALRLLVVEKFADLAPMEAGSHGWIDCPHRRVVAVQIKTHIAKCLSFRKGNRGCAGLLTTPCATTTGNCRWWENSEWFLWLAWWLRFSVTAHYIYLLLCVLGCSPRMLGVSPWGMRGRFKGLPVTLLPVHTPAPHGRSTFQVLSCFTFFYDYVWTQNGTFSHAASFLCYL